MSGSDRGSRIGALIALVLVAAFFLFEFVARILPSLAIDQIAYDFGLSNARLGTLSSVFFWIYAPMQLVVGALLDRYGAKRLVVPACAICALGVLLFGITDAPVLAALGRALTGFGASFAFVSALFVVTHQFPPERFSMLSGVVNMVGMIGAAIGAVLLTDVMVAIGWRVAFVATGATGLLIATLMLFFIPSTDSGVREAPAPSLLVGFGPIFRNRRLWIIALCGALYYMPINVFGGLWRQSDLMQDHGLSQVSAEFAVSMVFWGMAVGSVVAGTIADRTGRPRTIVVSNACIAAVFFGVVIYDTTSSFVLLSGALFLGGAFSGAQILTFAMAKYGEVASETGKIIAFVNMVGIASAVVFQPLIGELLDLSDGDYRIALSLIPACLVLTSIVMWAGVENTHTKALQDP
ncbi:MFS transporter [Roseobacter sinensis]|uniref:MFS transporter n=1 Tax=Roseobacter sinensis TaxID=2931391 RepID=A0ABT3BM20_9RHOB|nr:MFS transporter [Roseobacter sp. WL0113]MCV3274403.1 MFS transporter [Roseobacter sp. WL0113]